MRKRFRNLYLNLVGSIKKAQPGIHIINSHYVTPCEVKVENDYNTFESYLKFLNGFARFISLEEATERILEKKVQENEVLIAFTFDDGFEECYTVIAPLLEKYNTRGAFFINANYIDSTPEYQKDFNERVAITTKRPMTWQQIEDLHRRGHLIGSHNLDHTNFALLESQEMEKQIVDNKRILEEKLSYKCDYFAWTYGQLEHFPPDACQITKKYHKYIYSGTNYKEYFSYNEEVLNRRHQEAFWPLAHNRYFLSFKKKL